MMLIPLEAAADYEPGGRTFESCQARQSIPVFMRPPGHVCMNSL